MSKQIRVARGGKNALTSTDPNDFIFHSEYNTFKIIAEGSEEFVLGQTEVGTTESKLIEIAQSNQFVFAFCKFSDGRVGGPGTKAANANVWFTGFEVDGITLTFSFSNESGGNYTVTFKYIVCELKL
jgi:hypothetical protein